MQYLDGDEKKSIIIQTPRLKLCSDPIINENRSYLDVTIDQETPCFYNFIQNFDDFNIQTAFKKSEEWFSNQFEIEVIDDFYTPQLRLSKKTRKPMIRFKIPTSKGKILTNVYNEKKELINIEKLKENNEIILLLELNGMRFLKQQFLCEWTVHQIKKYEITKTEIDNKCLINDTEELSNDFEGPYDDDVVDGIDNDKLEELLEESIRKKELEEKRERKRKVY
jgi:hypothetical protein